VDGSEKEILCRDEKEAKSRPWEKKNSKNVAKETFTVKQLLTPDKCTTMTNCVTIRVFPLGEAAAVATRSTLTKTKGMRKRRGKGFDKNEKRWKKRKEKVTQRSCKGGGRGVNVN